ESRRSPKPTRGQADHGATGEGPSDSKRGSWVLIEFVRDLVPSITTSSEATRSDECIRRCIPAPTGGCESHTRIPDTLEPQPSAPVCPCRRGAWASGEANDDDCGPRPNRIHAMAATQRIPNFFFGDDRESATARRAFVDPVASRRARAKKPT